MAHLAPRIVPQPAVSGMVAIAALGSVVAAATIERTSTPFGYTLPDAMLTVALPLVIVLSYRFPIHIRRSTTVYLSTAPVFLIVALLPSLLAAVAAGLGVLGGELAIRKARKNYYSDVVTAASRFTVVALLASLVAHWFVPGGGWHVLGLVVAAAVLWAADTWTAPLVVAPMCGERPLHVLRQILRQSVTLEAVQYVMAIPSALVVADQPWALALLIAPTAVVYRYFKRARELHAGTYRLLERLADTVDQRDPYTGGHSHRVAGLCKAILTALPLGGPEAELIVAAARVHDIGKIDIPDHVLQKPSGLTEAERAVMQEHPERGAGLLLNNPGFARMAEMVRHHHESWDGSGYPGGLCAASIPFGSRVIAVADAYDAMTSDRPYRRGMAPLQAIDTLRTGKGSQWDAAIVDALIAALPTILVGAVEPRPAGAQSASSVLEPVALALAR